MAKVETKIVISGDAEGAKKALKSSSDAAKKAAQDVTKAEKEAEQATIASIKNMMAAEKSLQDTKERTKKIVATMAVASTAAFAGMLVIMKQAVDAAGEQEDAEVKLATALKNSGVYTKQAHQEMVKYADALQKTTNFADENIIAAMGMIQQFKKLNDEELKRLMPAVLNLAQHLGGGPEGLASASMLVAKTLGTSTNALQRQGIELNATATDTEKLNAVIDGLNQKMGGQAVAAAGTFTGALAGTKKAAGEVLEELGNLIIKSAGYSNGLQDVTKHLYSLRDMIAKNSDTSRVLIGTTIGLTGVTAGLLGGITALGILLPKLQAGWALLLPVLAKIKLAFMAIPFAPVVLATQTLIEATLALGKAYVTVADKKAKMLNVDITTGEYWDKEIASLEKRRKSLQEGIDKAWGHDPKRKIDPYIQSLDIEIARLKQVKKYQEELREKKRAKTPEAKDTVVVGGEVVAAGASAADTQNRVIAEARELEEAKRKLAMAGLEDTNQLRLKYLDIDIQNVKKNTAKWYQLQAEKKALLVKIKQDEAARMAEIDKKAEEAHDKAVQAEIDDIVRVANINKQVDDARAKRDAEALQKKQAQIDALTVKWVSYFDTFVSLTEQSMRTAQKTNESFFKAFGKGLAQLLKQHIRAKIMEVMATKASVIATALIMAVPTFGASLAAIPPALAAAAGGIAAIAALEALIPSMARGGIVKATSGGTIVRVGEAGRDEAIVPLGTGGMGGINYYTFHISSAIDLGLVTTAIQRGNPAAINLVKAINRSAQSVGREA